jgi:predicted metal-dependent hydrolase
MLDGDVPVSIYKRRASRSLRLSISPAGEVRVSIPTWAPYSAGLAFAQSKYDWILSERQPRQILTDGQAIGKAHHLRFATKSGAGKPASRVIPGAVLISYPPELTADDPVVQKAARNGSIRALRAQARQLLPQRLAKLAETHDFSYSGVNIKQLKSRWGSCDQDKVITLNLFLMQLPWEYIDYVLLHELMHTRIMRHGPDFWQAMTAIQPDAKALRKRLHEYHPVLDSVPAAGMQ